MNEKRDEFDFWYAVNNTTVVSMPSHRLETFGATIINYHLVSELMDTVDKVRIREGRIQALRPQIVAPEAYMDSMLEGFGDEAEKYVDWLRENAQHSPMLAYGFTIRKQEHSQHVVSDNVKAVTERVQGEVKEQDEAFGAVVRGVDKPWEVCLVKLMVEVMTKSYPSNVRDLKRRNLIGETDGVPNVIHRDIDAAFTEAARDPAAIKRLAAKLEKYGLLEKYQDRFFALVKSQA